MSAQFQLTSYRPGDETEILALWQRVFGSARSAERWRWQFADNPYGPPRAVLARTPAGELIGQYAVMPVALNVMGRQVGAAQSLDTMVHPDHRMHGIFEASAAACYDALRQQGCALVYGFPNRHSFPGFVRKLKWTRVAFPVQYSLTVSIAAGVGRRLPIPGFGWVADAVFGLSRQVSGLVGQALAAGRDGEWEIVSADKVPAGYDALWNAVKSFEILSLWKDAGYFGWRYDRHPSLRFQYHYIRRRGAIDALCVSTVVNGSCTVSELIVRDQSVSAARHLLSAVAQHARSAGARVLTFRGCTLDFFDEVFRGFDRRVGFGHVFCLVPLSPELPADVLDARNWTITEGDSDTL